MRMRTNVSITEEIKEEKRGGRSILLSSFVDFTTGSDWQMSAKKGGEGKKRKDNRQTIDTGLEKSISDLFLKSHHTIEETPQYSALNLLNSPDKIIPTTKLGE